MLRILGVFSILIAVVLTQRIPMNPCPDVFNYFQEPNGNIYGLIKLPTDGTKSFKIEVNVSMTGTYRNQKLGLELATPTNTLTNAVEVSYKLHLPRQDVLPKITNIKFNGRNYCSGPGETLTTEGVLNLWIGKETILRTYNPNDNNNNYVSPDFSAYTSTTPKYYYSTRKPFYPDDYNTLPTESYMSSTEAPYEYATRRPYPIVQDSNRHTRRPTHPPFIAPRPVQPHYPDYFFSTPSPAPDVYDDPDCGVVENSQTLVVGGRDTFDDEFPWLVAIYKSNEVSYDFQCTGNLISSKHVITAAHCLRYFNSDLVSKEDVLLIMGKSNLTHWAGSEAVLRAADKVTVHPDYRQGTGTGDVAVITLNKPVTFTRFLKPICLWKTSHDLETLSGTYGTIAGWGKDEKSQKYVAKPRKIEMPAVSQEECNRSNPKFAGITSNETFCAGQKNGVSGPCTGDSGAGFTIQKDRRWILRGIVSTTIEDRSTTGCNLKDYIVFADVGKLFNWIKSQLVYD